MFLHPVMNPSDFNTWKEGEAFWTRFETRFKEVVPPNPAYVFFPTVFVPWITAFVQGWVLVTLPHGQDEYTICRVIDVTGKPASVLELPVGSRMKSLWKGTLREAWMEVVERIRHKIKYTGWLRIESPVVYEGVVVREEGMVVRGRRQGLWKHYDPNKFLYRTVNYVNDRWDGVETLFYPGTKTIRYTRSWDRGKRSGLFESFHPSGRLASSYTIHPGDKHVVETVYPEKDLGWWVNTVCDKTDRLDGSIRAYYSDGTLRMETKFRDGAEIGPRSEFRMDGILASATTFPQPPKKGLLRLLGLN